MEASRTIPLTGIRGTIARRMSDSASAALVTLNTTADVTEALAMQRKLTREWRRSRVRPQYQDLVIAATVRTLKDHPLANAHITDKEVQIFDTINLGFALAVPDGLLVPVIRDAGTKSPLELAVVVRDLVRKSKSNELSVAELSGSTFSLTNLFVLRHRELHSAHQSPGSRHPRRGTRDPATHRNEVWRYRSPLDRLLLTDIRPPSMGRRTRSRIPPSSREKPSGAGVDGGGVIV